MEAFAGEVVVGEGVAAAVVDALHHLCVWGEGGVRERERVEVCVCV